MSLLCILHYLPSTSLIYVSQYSRPTRNKHTNVQQTAAGCANATKLYAAINNTSQSQH